MVIIAGSWICNVWYGYSQSFKATVSSFLGKMKLLLARSKAQPSLSKLRKQSAGSVEWSKPATDNL